MSEVGDLSSSARRPYVRSFLCGRGAFSRHPNPPPPPSSRRRDLVRRASGKGLRKERRFLDLQIFVPPRRKKRGVEVFFKNTRHCIW